jgi:serine/threonine-protein kinase
MAESALLARYDVLLELALGGMASVHLGRRIGAAGFDRLVVIKRIHRHLLANEGARAMFVDEARLTSNVHHPNVVPIVDVFDEEGELALVMEYVESVSLAALITAAQARDEQLPLDVVSRIVGDALLGLHAAHEAVNAEGASLDLVHRDVSPQNIIVGTDGAARLIDFGIAKTAERVATTKDGSLKGKLRYMSPEQARREPLDRRSDVFAAGLVLYEAIAGRPAIAGNDEATIWISLVLGELEPLPGLSPALTEVVAHALEQRAADRPPTALEFEERLRAAIPPATPAAVAACVERYLGPELALVREAIRDARRGAPLPARALAANAIAPPIVATESRTLRSRRLPLAMLAVLVAIGLVRVVTRVRESSSGSAENDTGAVTAIAPSATPLVNSLASEVISSPSVPSARPATQATAKRVTPKPPTTRSTRKLRDNPYPN